jgi:hypothetical protein
MTDGGPTREASPHEHSGESPEGTTGVLNIAVTKVMTGTGAHSFIHVDLATSLFVPRTTYTRQLTPINYVNIEASLISP